MCAFKFKDQIKLADWGGCLSFWANATTSLILVGAFGFCARNNLPFCFTDKFTVLSFLEALEDSVAKTMESGEADPRQEENKDAETGKCGGSDSMDESW